LSQNLEQVGQLARYDRARQDPSLSMGRDEGWHWTRSVVYNCGVLIDLSQDVIVMDVKFVLGILTVVFTVACLFFGTKNGFYDSKNYHGNGSAH